LPVRRGGRAGRQRPGVPAQPGVRDFAAAPGAGAGALEAGPRGGAGEALDAGGAAVAVAGPPRLQAALLRPPPGPAPHLPPRTSALCLAVRGRAPPNTPTMAVYFPVGWRASPGEACLGRRREVCDAEPPFTSRGCAAQAWSVAEVLRRWVRLARDGGRP